MDSPAEDLSIILWDLSSGRKLKTMTGHTSSLTSLSFSSESTVLVSGSLDGTVRVWDVLDPGASTNDEVGSRKFGTRESGLAEKLRRGSAIVGMKEGGGGNAKNGGAGGSGGAGAMVGLLPSSSLEGSQVVPS